MSAFRAASTPRRPRPDGLVTEQANAGRGRAPGSSGGTTSPAPKRRTVSPMAPTSLTTAGRPLPTASARTPDASMRRYGRTTTVAEAISAGISSPGTNPAATRCGRRRRGSPPGRAAARRARRAGRPRRSAGPRERRAATSGSARMRTSRPLYRRMSPKKRSVDPEGAAAGSRWTLSKAGCGISTIFPGSTPSSARRARGAAEWTTTRSTVAKTPARRRPGGACAAAAPHGR